jgi:hypothetical protein
MLIDCVDVNLRDYGPGTRVDSLNVPKMALEKPPPMLGLEPYRAS